MQTNSVKYTQNKDKTFVLTIALPQSELKDARNQALRSHQTHFEAKGFRKGKAPLNLVEEHIGVSHLIEDVLQSLISKAYSEAVTTHKLHPIIQPQIKALNPPLDFNKDWQIELTGCELPEIKINPDYQKAVTKVNQSKADDNEKINQIIEILIRHSEVELPEILINSDVQNKLSQLVDQTQSAGVTVDQYLKSRNQTIKEYQEQLVKNIKAEWTTNLAIDKISRDQKMEISQSEVDAVVAKNTSLAKNLNLVYYLLTQQKVFEYLRKL